MTRTARPDFSYAVTVPMPLEIGRSTMNGDLEWDELPVVADSIARRLARVLERHRREGTSHSADDALAPRWSRSQAAEFDALPMSAPFHEAMQGLATREVNDPAVFRYFFGAARHS